MVPVHKITQLFLFTVQKNINITDIIDDNSKEIENRSQ